MITDEELRKIKGRDPETYDKMMKEIEDAAIESGAKFTAPNYSEGRRNFFINNVSVVIHEHTTIPVVYQYEVYYKRNTKAPAFVGYFDTTKEVLEVIQEIGGRYGGE